MDNILPENEYTEVEGRLYSNPQIGIDESNTFIDNLRAAQGQQNQEIAQQTQRLGTDIPTNLGGLTGADSYFTSRYQTPYTNSTAANLRATAQAAALNEVLANEQAIWKKRYQDAYRNYQKRSYNKAYGSNGSSGSGSNTGDDAGNSSTWNGDVVDVPTGYSAAESLTLSTETPGDMGAGIRWVVNPATTKAFNDKSSKLEFYRIDESKDINDPEYQTLYRQQDDGNLVRVGS